MPSQAPLFAFDSPKGQSSYIKVIGVGGGGGNAVNHMFREGITGVDFIVCNTDMKALGASPVPNKIPLGSLGLGAGGKPEKARKAALDKTDSIKEALAHNTQMLFITAGMGGGTGTGAAPVIADIAKSITLDNEENEEILVVAIVTRPFTFEGRQRMEQAEAGIKALREKVDSIIIIDNDKLFGFGDLTMSQAYAMADDVLLTAAKGIAEIISKEGYICRDFQDINSVMEHSGRALMGTGSGRGENRAKDAINAATKSVLLDDSDITGAKNVLLYFTSSHEYEMTIREQMEITDYVCQATGGFADVKYGAGYDDELGDELKVTLIATGFDKVAKSEPEEERVHVLTPDTDTKPVDTTKPVESESNNTSTEPYIVTKSIYGAPVDTAEPAATVGPVKQTQPATPQPVIHVRGLYDDEPVAEEKKVAKDEAVDDNSLVDGIKYISREPAQTMETPAAPAATVAPVVEEVKPVVEEVKHVVEETKPVVEEPIQQTKTTVASLIHGAFHSDNAMMNASDRIRKIHELLRNDPAGADKVMAMTTQQLAEDSMSMDYNNTPHSSKQEAARYSVQPDGSMVEIPTLHGKAD